MEPRSIGSSVPPRSSSLSGAAAFLAAVAAVDPTAFSGGGVCGKESAVRVCGAGASSAVRFRVVVFGVQHVLAGSLTSATAVEHGYVRAQDVSVLDGGRLP
jgi:hypothetical protein